MSSNFHVGQRVVALKSLWIGTEQHTVGMGNDFPIEGNVYIIAELDLAEDGKVYLDLVEMPAGRSFHSVFFRPAVEPRSDISLFKAMLTPSKARIDA